MYAAERQQAILAEARRNGRVEVTAMAGSLGVVTETVRRDLAVLERRGSLRRVHGGALPIERFEQEPTLADKMGRLSEVKRRIAARALDEMPEDGTVLLDSGSTTLALVAALPPDISLTVITNSIAMAAALMPMPRVNLFVLGGRVRGRTGAAVGEWLTSALGPVTVDVAFLGTNGVSVGRGLTTPDQTEAAAKTAMVSAARRAVLLTDSTKFGLEHFHRFATVPDIDLVITDDKVDDDTAAAIAAAGPEVVRVRA